MVIEFSVAVGVLVEKASIDLKVELDALRAEDREIKAASGNRVLWIIVQPATAQFGVHHPFPVAVEHALTARRAWILDPAEKSGQRPHLARACKALVAKDMRHGPGPADGDVQAACVAGQERCGS